MIEDIVKRLRLPNPDQDLSTVYTSDLHEAADEIERLRAELAAERERVKEVMCECEFVRQQLAAELRVRR